MIETVRTNPRAGLESARATTPLSRPTYQAFLVLYAGFIALPILAGADKFFHVLVNWDQYLAPWVAGQLPVSGHTFMLAVGAIEIVAGILVFAWPRVGAVGVALWLWGILVNLLLLANSSVVALRDFGLYLAELAM